MKEKQLAVIKHFGMDHQRRKLEEEVLENQHKIILFAKVWKTGQIADYHFYRCDNNIWKEHMRKFFNITNRPLWKLEDFYIPHKYDLLPINYPF